LGFKTISEEFIMQKINRLIIFATALLMFGGLDVWAQPGGGGRGESGGGRGGAMMAMRSVPIEQILGFLAFDEKVGLSNEMLGKVRDELKAIHADRATLVKKLAGSEDREAAMTEVRRLRGQMTQKLSAILQPNQVDALKTYMQNMNQRGGQGGRGGDGGRRRGGGGDGGGGDGA
jgi:hypothetical protein